MGGFRQIGWAFLFIGISVGIPYRDGDQIFSVDLLPDFIGYLMIATAADRLIVVHRRARVVRNLALLLTFLTVPTIVQYAGVGKENDNATRALFWAPTVITSLLDLVLVWNLCGLVADLSRRAGDRDTEKRACTYRALYVLLRVAMLAVVGMNFVASSGALVLGAAVVGIGGGLIVLIMMIRLMGRAEWLLPRLPDVDEPDPGVRRGGWVYRLLVFMAIALPVLLMAEGIYYYYCGWKPARDNDMRRASNSSYFSPARDAFFDPLQAGRTDEAYAATSESFQRRISREQFGELARRYDDYRKARQQHNMGGGAGTSEGNSSRTEYEYVVVEIGKTIVVTWTIRRDPDSIFLRQPPPFQVDDFTIEERTAPPGRGPMLGPPFGQKL